MDIAMAGFAAYQLVNVDTGITLYQTIATEAEILAANHNLRARGLTSRYVPAGTFSAPNLHAA
jgi:hypothetical protein